MTWPIEMELWWTSTQQLTSRYLILEMIVSLVQQHSYHMISLSLYPPGLITLLANSLFTYAADEGPMTYHDPQWMPAFTDDILNQASPQVLADCTPAGASEPIQQCVFDAVATGDVSIGMATANTLNENTLAMEESSESSFSLSSLYVPSFSLSLQLIFLQ